MIFLKNTSINDVGPFWVIFDPPLPNVGFLWVILPPLPPKIGGYLCTLPKIKFHFFHKLLGTQRNQIKDPKESQKAQWKIINFTLITIGAIWNPWNLKRTFIWWQTKTHQTAHFGLNLYFWRKLLIFYANAGKIFFNLVAHIEFSSLRNEVLIYLGLTFIISLKNWRNKNSKNP